MARKWDGNSADKPVLDYSQKEDGEAAAGDRQDITQPLADLSLKSRVDVFDDDEEGERIPAILAQFALASDLARRVIVTLIRNLELGIFCEAVYQVTKYDPGQASLQSSHMHGLHTNSSLCLQTVRMRMRMTRRQHPADSPAALKRLAAAAS